MKNTMGSAITITLFGESHGARIGCVLDGVPPGIPVLCDEIARALDRRRPAGNTATARREQDAFSLVSGVKNNRATGTPICLLIENQDTRSADYKALPLRPGHADYTAWEKYHGFQDARGGGHFSGRLTAPLVAAGAIFAPALRQKGIFAATHVLSIGAVKDRAFSQEMSEEIALLHKRAFPVLSEDVEAQMTREILAAKADGDSVGGVLETAICGVPAGVGEPWFDSVESVLSHALFSIPAVKGVDFGAGFALSSMRGSEANDPMVLKGDKVGFESNRCGGVLGGITNGMPIVFRTAIKPTPTIVKEQHTVDFENQKEVVTSFGGRHDPCIVPRAAVVAESLALFCVADLLTLRFGTDYLAKDAR